MKTCIVIPILNEIRGLKEIAHKIKPEWYNRIIILDGGSTDGTLEFAKEKTMKLLFRRGVG